MTTGLILVPPLPIASVTASSGAAVAAKMLTGDPKEVWVAEATGAVSIDIDLGEETEVDSVFLGYTNADAAATLELRTMTSAGGAGQVIVQATGPLGLNGTIGLRPHGLVLLDDPVTTRWLRINTNQPGGADPLFAGIVLAGKRYERAYEYRAGRRPIDLGKRHETQGGGFGFNPGARKSSFRCTLSDMDDAALEELWSLVMNIGEGSPMLFVEGHEGSPLHSQVHYGLFQTFEPFERADPADTRWALSMIDWI